MRNTRNEVTKTSSRTVCSCVNILTEVFEEFFLFPLMGMMRACNTEQIYEATTIAALTTHEETERVRSKE